MRIAGAVFAILGMAVPVLLEIAGWISSSCEFADNHMSVMPQMLELHAIQTKRRLRVQTWHLSRIGDALTNL